jgi:hypothetical protein
MKGIVFNTFERVVSDAHGEDRWEEILEGAGVSGVYTAVGSYDDTEMVALLGAAAQILDQDADAILRWFGAAAMPHFAERYPQFFAPHTTIEPFLRTLNDVIHPEVRKLFPGAYAPEFTFETIPGGLALGYHSHRNLCSFAEGLIDGAAAHFGETVEISQSSCQKRGDPHCVMVVRLSP